MKKFLFLSSGDFVCNCLRQYSSDDNKQPASSADQSKPADANPSYDQKRGEGKFSKVDVSATLDVPKADAGSKVYSC